MFVHHRTSGFILKKIDRRETDQLLTIYTKDFGKLEILAKAVRKIFSKLKSGAEIFYLSEIEFIQGKTRKTLTDAILIEKFENLRKDLKRIKIAYKISEFLDNLISGQEPDEKIWRLLNEVFDKLNNLKLEIKNWKPEIFYYYFIWNLLSVLGYEPELYNCVLCQKKLALGKLFLNSKEGGIICHSCQKSVKSTKLRSAREIGQWSKEIKPETIKILRILLKRDWLTLKRLKIEAKDLNFLKIISDCFVSGITPVLEKNQK